jgi:putative heme iron utilization protein
LATFRRAKRNPGHPYVSKVGLALDGLGQPIFLFSTLAAHTQDLLADGRCSVLIEAPVSTSNPLQSARATLSGMAVRLDGDAALSVREVYLARHPGAARYVDFGDFAFWTMTVDKIHFVAGFGSAKWAKGADYVTECGNLARARVLAELNGAKYADLLNATGHAQGWRAVDIDPDGVTLASPKGRLARHDFLAPAKDLRSWRAKFAASVKRPVEK